MGKKKAAILSVAGVAAVLGGAAIFRHVAESREGTPGHELRVERGQPSGPDAAVVAKFRAAFGRSATGVIEGPGTEPDYRRELEESEASYRALNKAIFDTLFEKLRELTEYNDTYRQALEAWQRNSDPDALPPGLDFLQSQEGISAGVSIHNPSQVDFFRDGSQFASLFAHHDDGTVSITFFGTDTTPSALPDTGYPGINDPFYRFSIGHIEPWQVGPSMQKILELRQNFWIAFNGPGEKAAIADQYSSELAHLLSKYKQ